MDSYRIALAFAKWKKENPNMTDIETIFMAGAKAQFDMIERDEADVFHAENRNNIDIHYKD